MMGGYEVQGAADARVLTALLKPDPDMPIRPGQILEEPPCLPWETLEIIRAREGRPCPRVELDPDNQLAASVVMLSLREHTRPLIGPLTSGMSKTERHRTFVRAAAALQSEAVIDWLTPKPPKASS
jgi:hypothetical protein